MTTQKVYIYHFEKGENQAYLHTNTRLLVHVKSHTPLTLLTKV